MENTAMLRGKTLRRFVSVEPSRQGPQLPQGQGKPPLPHVHWHPSLQRTVGESLAEQPQPEDVRALGQEIGSYDVHEEGTGNL